MFGTATCIACVGDPFNDMTRSPPKRKMPDAMFGAEIRIVGIGDLFNDMTRSLQKERCQMQCLELISAL